jgi:hypothetical protein
LQAKNLVFLLLFVKEKLTGTVLSVHQMKEISVTSNGMVVFSHQITLEIFLSCTSARQKNHVHFTGKCML